jgi:CheY-like chemotaxis protein
MRRTTFRVLVIEDEAVSRMAAIRELEKVKNGFEVEVMEAATLEAGLSRLPHAHCVLLDLTLPDSRGPEDACTRVRDAMEMSGKVPVVVHTGSDKPEEWVAACRIVATTVVTKGSPLGPAIAGMFGLAQRHSEAADIYREFLESASQTG